MNQDEFSSVRETVARYRLNDGWPDYRACKFCYGPAGFRFSDGNKAVYQCGQCDAQFVTRRYPVR